MPETSLPIGAILPELKNTLQREPAAVLQAPPGAGKTTRVPLALLDEPWLAGQKILMLEPRRLAARAAAMRMADTLGETAGQTVGYRTRFDSQISKQTRIEVLTEGILTRRLQQDQELAGVGLVIFDEFHERNLQADLGLALCLESRQILRPDLKLLVMSATLDGAAVARLLGNAPIVSSEGRSFPVVIHYLDEPDPIAEGTARAVLKILPDTQGDVLVFLPGSGEIRRADSALRQAGLPSSIRVFPLYGDLSRDAQDAAIRPSPPGQRKIVLATNIAETSLTIEGVMTVVDSGWRRSPRFDPRAGLSRLELSRIARDSAEQRAGRAGRLAPGHCFRLWSAGRQDQLAARSTPEMVEADLADLAMDLAQWGADAMQLAWLDPPPKGALAQARELLTLLEALDESGKITALGRQMAGWPLHPRLAHMLCRAIPLGWAAVACDTAALLSERDVIRSRDTDLLLRLKALQAFRERGRGGANSVGADAEACRRVDQVAKQLRDKVKIPLPSRAEALPRHDGLGGSAAFDTEHALGALLALAYPDRVAARRADGRYRLANGRGAALPEGDGLGREAWLVAAHLDAGEREGRIYLAAALREEDLLRLLADKIQSRDFTGWDEQQACVIARREQRLGQLVISSATLEKPDPDACRAALLSGIRRLDLLPWNDAARALQARAEAARGWFPNENWPNLSDEFLLQNLAAWLSPWIAGMSRLSHLSRLNLLEILQSQLDWPQRRELDEIAPTHLRVPSGSSIALEYPAGQAPVLAVRLQEVFGWQDTPRIGRGQVPVLLHLLSPARRPIQVTQDLRGFWQRTYVEVKKELKGRYPKHYWPDDPLQAIPMRGARPRG